MKAIEGTNLNVTKVVTPGDLAHAALETFISDANEAIRVSGSFNVAISGGQSPTGFFELLGTSSRGQALDWSKVQIFWVDERCVPPEADASNYGLAANTFLDKVPVPEENVHRVSGEFSDYSLAVRAYEEVIRGVFGMAPGQMPQFDLIVLGMGPDGHIGSLLPNSYALFDTNDIVSVVYMMDGNYSRITLTHPVLCSARHLMVLVSGAEKAKILSEVIQAEPDRVKYPVHTLWPILDKVTWIVDSEAGKYL